MNLSKVLGQIQGKPLLRLKLWDINKDCGCILGTLLVGAGADPEELDMRSHVLHDEFQLLEKEYGVTEAEAMVLMNWNDGFYCYNDRDRGELLTKMINDKAILSGAK